jgi:hypothetical protein
VFFSDSPLFISQRLALWQPGDYTVAITLTTDGGEKVESNAAPLKIVLPGADDTAVWEAYTTGGVQPLTPFSFRLNFAPIEAYPASEYYRHVAPFVMSVQGPDLDRYASDLIIAVQGLPGAYVDAARYSIAMRYEEKAGGYHVINDQISAGEWSAKGRVYAQQLIDTPGSPLGPLLGAGMKRILRTTAEWQEEYDRIHRVQPAPEPAEQPIRAFVTCSKETGHDVSVTFGYENPNRNPVTLTAGEKNRFYPAPDYRGQPTTFLPGRHEDAVTVVIDGKKKDGNRTVLWTLDRTSISAPTDHDPKCKKK